MFLTYFPFLLTTRSVLDFDMPGPESSPGQHAVSQGSNSACLAGRSENAGGMMHSAQKCLVLFSRLS